jgi:hypothetical protein
VLSRKWRSRWEKKPSAHWAHKMAAGTLPSLPAGIKPELAFPYPSRGPDALFIVRLSALTRGGCLILTLPAGLAFRSNSSLDVHAPSPAVGAGFACTFLGHECGEFHNSNPEMLPSLRLCGTQRPRPPRQEGYRAGPAAHSARSGGIVLCGS